MRHLTLQLLLCFAVQFAVAQLEYRPNREFRSLNTGAYQIAIQKNGELDVSLASGEPLFVDAFPMVWIEGDHAPRPMTVDGSWSSRFPTRDPLGEGNGMALRKKECTWSIRTYPTKPFMAVQVAYENISKKPVTVRALFPWSIGEPRKGLLHLGTNTRDSMRRDRTIALPHRDARGEYLGERNVAIYNPVSKRSLIAGFLTHQSARAEFVLDAIKPEKHSAFDLARFGCYFDPPITLEPGETLESDVLYLGVIEADPITGLERFARATQAVNQIPSMPGAPAHVWLQQGDVVDAFANLVGTYSNTRSRPPRPHDLFEQTPYQHWLWIDSGIVTLALTNDSTEAVTDAVALNDLGLNGGVFHHLYDVQQQQYLGAASGIVSVEMEPQESRVIRFVPRQMRPQVVIHTTNPFRAAHEEWVGTTLKGSLTVQNALERILLTVPEPYRPVKTETSFGSATLDRDGGLFVLTLDSDPGSDIEWSISFDSVPSR